MSWSWKQPIQAIGIALELYRSSQQNILRIDLDNPSFEIRTPLVHMLKKETMHLAYQMGILDYLLKETITCYEGIPHRAVKNDPACRLRNEGLRQFLEEMPNITFKLY